MGNKAKELKKLNHKISVMEERMKTKHGLVDQNIAVKLSELYKQLAKLKAVK